MKLKGSKLLGGFNRFRLILTLGLAVLLPAAALIYVNFTQLRSFQRDKVLEATINRDFHEVPATTEKRMNKKAYAKVAEAREMFPSPDEDSGDKEKKLDRILAECSCFAHAFLVDEEGMTFRSPTPADEYLKKEHERLSEMFSEWFNPKEGKMFAEQLQK